MSATETIAPTTTTNGAAPQPMPTNVIAALARVMGDLPGIGRTEHSEQGYDYRGIESITRHAQSLFARYGIVFVPRVVSRTTRELSINNRPWTEEQMEIVYRVYGPGGVDDFIEVGPLIGLGRDNSDKGCNKSMTQAYKYALIQTLCIGDAKDDADREQAHEADPVPTSTDWYGWTDEASAMAAHAVLADAIKAGSDETKEACKAWRTEHGVGWPMSLASFTEFEVYAKGLLSPSEAPVVAQEAPPASDGPTTPETGGRASRAAQVASEAGVDPAAVVAEDERRTKARDDARAIADDLEGGSLDASLAALDPNDDCKGTDAAKRKRFVTAMVREFMREDADGTLGV